MSLCIVYLSITTDVITEGQQAQTSFRISGLCYQHLLYQRDCFTQVDAEGIICHTSVQVCQTLT